MPPTSATERCAICSAVMDFYTLDERQGHYEAHFAEGASASTTAASYTSSSHASATSRAYGASHQSSMTSANSKSSSTYHPAPSPKQNVFWHSFERTEPPKNYTPCLIPILKRIFTKLNARGLSTNVVLCAEGVCHVNTEWFDLGWGCGYRNFLMCCTGLIAQQHQPMYFALLDVANGSVVKDAKGKQKELTGPGVRGLQAWIQDAWHDGYDFEGANDKAMNWNLVGTKKFIGTSDISIAFTRCGIPSSLVDFPKPKSSSSSTASSSSFSAHSSRSRMSEPSIETSATALIRWIVNYFDNVPQPGMSDGLSPGSPLSPAAGGSTNAFDRVRAEAVVISPRMPIILQHNGHSRTIVGYEKMRNGAINLLIFDPAPQKKPSNALRQAALALHRASLVSSVSSPSSSSSPSASRTAHDHSTSSSSKVHDIASKANHFVHKIQHHLSPSSHDKHQKRATTADNEDGPSALRPPKRVRGGLNNVVIDLEGSSSEGENDSGGTAAGQALGGSSTKTLREKVVLEFEGDSDDDVVALPSSSSASPSKTKSNGASAGASPIKKEKSEARKEADALIEALDPVAIAKNFRVNITSLNRKDQYQILFFPLTDPLTDHQKEMGKVVKSTIIAHDPLL